MLRAERWYGTSGNGPCGVINMEELKEAMAQVATRQKAQAAEPESVTQALKRTLNGGVEGATRATDTLYQ